jgi:uncharacterized integral membrane protein (TIGR00697 family)
MNELLFFIHILIVFGFALVALKIGKEALIAWVALQAVLANLFVLKQICFFGFHVTCSDVFAIGSLLGLNLLREHYDQESANRALLTCFFCMIFFVVMAEIHLFYLPSQEDTAHPGYQAILSSSPRLLFASIGVFFIVQQIDLRLFNYVKEKLSKLPLGLRNALVLSSSQLIDTILFSLFGLWGLVSSLTDIILVSFGIKLVIIALLSPTIALSKRLIPTNK